MNEKTHYGKLEYWEDYYNSNSNKTFDWFQDFIGIKDVLFLTFDLRVDRSEYVILDAGCGSSEVLKNLYLAGCSNLTGIDANPTVINFLRQRDAPINTWVTCDLKRPNKRCSTH